MSGILVQRVLDSRPWEKYTQFLLAISLVPLTEAKATIVEKLGPESLLGDFLYRCVQSLNNIHLHPPALPANDYEDDIYTDLARLRRVLELYQRTRLLLQTYEYSSRSNHLVMKELVTSCQRQCEEASSLFTPYSTLLVVPTRTLRNWLENHDLRGGISVAETILRHSDKEDLSNNVQLWVPFDAPTVQALDHVLDHYTEIHAGIVSELHDSMKTFCFIEPVLVDLDPGMEPYILYLRSSARIKTCCIIDFAERYQVPLFGTVAQVRASLVNPSARNQVRFLRHKGTVSVRNVVDSYDRAWNSIKT
jgi:hypothetical protein